ncbi:MAG: helix-turn-helix transcriptional regulator, partial [Desulfobulbaceae bacterium]|nr:helix-turn-helix transcriptional regulator [Desulfobulbaceae bacterium]
MRKNPLRKFRESLMISKAELARKANISPLTIARIEQGKPCR